jgi:hypothetical protein
MLLFSTSTTQDAGLIMRVAGSFHAKMVLFGQYLSLGNDGISELA